MALSTHMTQHQNLLIVALEGELEFSTAPSLVAAVDAVLPVESPSVVVDTAGVTFCDSHGLEALLEVQRMVSRAGGSMELVHVNGRLRRLLRLSGLDRAFVIA
ncbi:STAS domain-containing protein [Nonomuraea sp. NPDC049486]|uniref:Anti-sigma factor antagonist n=1 Tax=Nonomuraea harbinensis TaxID=1286938 RepID=A0ABW1BVQ1_9ACTN|nr:STAS domain-containing protein [Nonomuraea harbinensis]